MSPRAPSQLFTRKGLRSIVLPYAGRWPSWLWTVAVCASSTVHSAPSRLLHWTTWTAACCRARKLPLRAKDLQRPARDLPDGLPGLPECQPRSPSPVTSLSSTPYSVRSTPPSRARALSTRLVKNPRACHTFNLHLAGAKAHPEPSVPTYPLPVPS
jgi:hypothetical protein